MIKTLPATWHRQSWGSYWRAGWRDESAASFQSGSRLHFGLSYLEVKGLFIKLFSSKIMFHATHSCQVDPTPNTHSPLVPTCLQSTPSLGLLSFIWHALTAANCLIGSRPEFSAKARGTDSRASAKAWRAYCSMSLIWKKNWFLTSCKEEVFYQIPVTE